MHVPLKAGAVGDEVRLAELLEAQAGYVEGDLVRMDAKERVLGVRVLRSRGASAMASRCRLAVERA
jgi:hypothetical protein